ncbi:MAG: hypothetical protein JXC85_00275 [Candidatus Aenigmarchaeota archaeon]|nr:hypothetical protein [Candidatus Aenigmarchaeota archaeon]
MVKQKEMYDDDKAFEKTFDCEFLSEYLRQAQWAEMVELKKAIFELHFSMGKPISLLDVGIGNARFPKHLSGIREIWDLIGHYDGIDNVQGCVDLSNRVVSEMGLEDKVDVALLDAVNLDALGKKYGMIIFTWFTAGNFYPMDFPFDSYQTDTQERYDLSRNEKFERIFRNSYDMLESGGEIVIGFVYVDNDSTRKKQEDFYTKCGMTVTTDERDTFTATKERFWSQRFTEGRVRDYLGFVPKGSISFTNLDTYNFAMMIRVGKYF